jgi:methylthioribose-1-phosphate isomerase
VNGAGAGAGAGAGGMGAAMNASMTMNAGHQMDLHHLYEMVLELSEVLKNNREITKNIVSSAEEVMVCSDQDSRVTGNRANAGNRSMAIQRMQVPLCGMSTARSPVCSRNDFSFILRLCN